MNWCIFPSVQYMGLRLCFSDPLWHYNSSSLLKGAYRNTDFRYSMAGLGTLTEVSAVPVFSVTNGGGAAWLSPGIYTSRYCHGIWMYWCERESSWSYFTLSLAKVQSNMVVYKVGAQTHLAYVLGPYFASIANATVDMLSRNSISLMIYTSSACNMHGIKDPGTRSHQLLLPVAGTYCNYVVWSGLGCVTWLAQVYFSADCQV